ncbi:MAG TPA: hypothetical protein VH092_33450 [Urbifossiella sp.]|nr:hypothetical protein [Urbifossiella sp.]
MNVRTRVAKRNRLLGGRLPPGELSPVVAAPVGCGMADDLPPGVHYNVDGRVASVVYEGPDPDQR